MADTPQDLLGDPEFQKLSPEAQHIVIGKKFPEYAKLSPEAQKIVLSSTKIQTAPEGTTPENMAAVTEANKANSPYPLTSPAALPGVAPSLEPNISGSRALTPEEQAQENDVFKKGMPMLAANVASEGAASLPLLARMAVAGGTGGLTSAAVGGDKGDIATNTAIGAGAEVPGAAAKFIGEKLTPMASQSLARILKLSPKAFQFGREPAQEVLERGLASGSLKETASSIGEASKQVTSELNDMLKKSSGTVDAFAAGTEASKSIPNTAAANRFEQLVLDAADKLGLKNLGKLSNADANALKQEVARQARFVEGDLRPSVAGAAKAFGGKIKDGIISNVPAAEDLLQSSANLTEASKGADYAVRAEKAGQGRSGLSAVDIKKPATYPRLATDTIKGTSLLFKAANGLRDSGVPISQALRMAFGLVYPNTSEE